MKILILCILVVFVGFSGSTSLAAQQKKTTQKKAPAKKTVKKPVKKKTAKKAAPLPPAKVVPSSASHLDPVRARVSATGVTFEQFPHFSAVYQGKVTGLTPREDFIFYSIDPRLQKKALSLVTRARAPHIAIVAMEPKSGRVLAMSGKSISLDNILTHAGFPAASLFKIVTAAAALEKGKVNPETVINYRGGTYLLDRSNILADPKKDRMSMTVADAIGKSCNPVFARIALNHLSSGSLQHYAQRFGFNSPLQFETGLPVSSAYIPSDPYGLGRTAAGFGDVFISPVHAAALISGVANGGILPRASLVDSVLGPQGNTLFTNKPAGAQRMLSQAAAREVLDMMESTTLTGTSRRAFTDGQKRRRLPFRVSGKTGTLTGKNPQGLNNWFIGAAPIDNPKIAVAVIVVNPQDSASKASQIAYEIFKEHLT